MKRIAVTNYMALNRPELSLSYGLHPELGDNQTRLHKDEQTMIPKYMKQVRPKHGPKKFQ